jgi:hypothetical protein
MPLWLNTRKGLMDNYGMGGIGRSNIDKDI